MTSAGLSLIRRVLGAPPALYHSERRARERGREEKRSGLAESVGFEVGDEFS